MIISEFIESVLLCGDPGLGKSKLLQSMSTIREPGSFISGSGVTSAGLTAAVVKRDGDTMLEAGALPLTDGGICCIDEFDKMPNGMSDSLLEVMEQQTVTISKAEINSQLIARTSVVCACNPKKDGVDFMSDALVSRFDLIMYLRDNMELDQRIASHLLNKSNGLRGSDDMHPPISQDLESLINFSSSSQEPLPEELIRTYVNYARTYCPSPTISHEAKVRIISLYFAKKAECQTTGKKVTFRYFESLIRLSEARAKGDLSNEVSKRHVEDVAIILRSGLVDDGLVINKKRPRPNNPRRIIDALLQSKKMNWARDELIDFATSIGFDKRKAWEAIENLNYAGELLLTSNGYKLP